jgi:hypothetical protein
VPLPSTRRGFSSIPPEPTSSPTRSSRKGQQPGGSAKRGVEVARP